MSRLGHISVLIFASLLTTTVDVRAQQPLNQARGYDPTAVYSAAGIDNVNLFGGNSSMAIPLGQRYSVGPTLSYGFTLVYNTHVWDFQRTSCTQNWAPNNTFWGHSAALTKASNAGLGWLLTLGFLSVNDGGNISGYIDSGGGEHTFYQKLHADDAAGDSSYTYTRDGSYLRLHTTTTSATVEFPDGTIHTFGPSTAPDCTAPTAHCDWRLQGMADRFNNTVTVTYYDTANPPTWTVADSTGRSHTVTMGPSSLSIQRVASVSLAAFGGSSALYSFSYPATDSTIDMSVLSTQGCDGWPVDASATFLTGLQLPDGSAYSMLDAAGNPTYYTTSVGAADTSGAINQIHLPTGGVIKWTYAAWHLPSGCLYGGMPDLTTSLGVATRQLCDSLGGNCATWTYTRPTPGANDDFVTTTVTSPPAIANAAGNDGVSNDTVYYFRTHSCSTGTTDFSAWDYGLSYTQSVTDGSGHYLSSRSYLGSASSGTLKRSAYVAYEHDLLPTLDYPPTGSADTSPWQSTNRRLAYARTVYADDADKYGDVTSSSFDGLGHYRQADTGGTFASGNVRTTFTGFNPNMAAPPAYLTYQIAANNTQTGTWNHWAWPASKPWILGTLDATSQTENSVTAYQEACFERDADGYPSNGFLRAARVLKGAAEDQYDLLMVFTRDASGQAVSEQYLGGDTQSQALPTYCNAATSRVSGDQYRIDHTYQYGNLKTSRYVNAAGIALTFYLADRTIDQNTGLPSASRDTAAIQTNYLYDAMGRLTWEKPAQGAWMHYQYLRQGICDQPAKVETCAKANGITTECVDTAPESISCPLKPLDDSLTRSAYVFDGMGRPYLAAQKLPDDNWNQQKTLYNATGWTLWTSEWYPAGTADGSMSKTQYSSFDPFGRPSTITLPDAKTVSLTYTGVREVARTVKVQSYDASGQNPAERDATTTEVYDRQGRLYTLTESSGTSGANVTTAYSYDIGNRLKRVCMNQTFSGQTEQCTQERTFTFDNRGFVLWEDLPEKTTPAGQSHDVTYLSYDAASHAGRVVDGPNDRTTTYDRAGRPTNVKITSSNSLIDLAYATANAAGDYRNGKLRTATRHNWIGDPAVDNQVVETYTYGGVGGRVSQRSTTVEGRSISQSFTWNDLGQPATIGYPDDTTLAVDPARTVSATYTKGWLTAVPGFASGLSYSVNGMPSTITFANGVAVTQGLDPNRIQRIASIATSGALPNNWSTGAYAFDGAGNIKSIGAGGTKQTFVYDKVSRLVSGQALVGTALKTQSAIYDGFGNITSTTFNGGSPQTFLLDAATNRLNAPVTYDAAGNMTTWGDSTYTYTALGQLFTVTGTGINHTYLYTADGERISDREALTNAATLTIRGLDGKILRSWVKSGTAVAWVKDYVYAGGTLLASVAANPDEGTRFFALDHLGTPRLVTNACKAMVAQHAYYPFGMEATSSSQDAEGMKFTGQERDLMGTYSSQTDDLDNLHARSFNPNILRFLSADPLRGDPHRPQSFNLFVYVQGNPSNFVDPFGLHPSPCPPGSNPLDLTCNGMPNDPAPKPRVIEIITVWGKFFKTLGDRILPRGNTIGPDQQRGTQQQQKQEKASMPCSAIQAVSFVGAHQADAAAVAQQLGVPTQNVLGLSGIESDWGRSNAARFANNFFGLHGGASAPFATGVWYTTGGVSMSAFPSYLASGQSFAAQYGSYVSGVTNPTAFARALVKAGFNPGTAPFGNPNFVRDTAATINATAGRMECL